MGDRFLVKAYPMDKEFRRLKLSRQIVDKLQAHVDKAELKPDDLFFCWRNPPSERQRPAFSCGALRHLTRVGSGHFVRPRQ